MTQSKSVGQSQNALHELGYKIFLDRYALKDMTRQTLAVGDTVIVVVDSKTGQREVGEITALDLPKITVRLLDGSEVTRDIEHVDKPIETAPEQMMDRVARGIAEAEKTPEKQSEWQQKFRWLLDGWKFIPGGRILTGAGTDQELTYYNCMPPSQEVLTADGYKPIADIRVGDLVVTHRNRLRPVRHKFERETEELIYSINPKKIGFDSLRVTGEHKLPVMRGEWRDNAQNYNPVWIPASELRVGDYIALSFNGQPQSEQVLITREIALQQSGVAVQFAPAPIAEDEFEIAGEFEGLRWSQVDEITTENYCGVVMDMEVEEDHSFVSAGVVVSNCYVIPSPRDSRGGIIETLRQMTEIMSRGGGVGINISSLRPRHAYVKGVNGRSSGSVSWGALYSFVTGLIEQGGCFGPDERIATNLGLIPAKELADRIEAGEAIYAHTHKGLRRITAKFRNGIKPLYEVKTARGYSVKITEDHKVAVLMDGQITTMPLKYLQPNDEILLLLDPSEAQNPLTLPEMQRDASVQVQEAVASAKVLELDSITSITPLGDSDVYDFEVDDVHLLSGNGVYTSNSRRGALMLILNDWHPDVFDFINSKRQMGQITNANISVGVSDKLMEAVKADADWTLMFPDTSDPDYDEAWDGDLDKWIADGRKVLPYRTVKAAELWNAMIESAWASAEPGVWFRERSNKMANSWYFNPLISTNPCVTGETRIYTDHGLVKAVDLFEDETDIDAVIDGRFGSSDTLTPATRVFYTGRKPVYRLQTEEGYHVRATADHKIMTPHGWVELQDLKPGDKIYILNRKGGFGREGSERLGRILGWLVGDGTIKEDRAVLMFFGDEKRELAPMFAEYVNDIVEPMTVAHRSYSVGVVNIADRDEARVQSFRLRTLADQYGLVENKFQVPEVVFRGTEEMQRGFLQALFTADGSVQQTTSNAVVIRLASSHLELLEQVQMLLGNFGIACRIFKNRRLAHEKMMPDGKGGQKLYQVKAQHELHIAKQNTVTFMNEIGFLMAYKNEIYHERMKGYKKGPKAENFRAVVQSVQFDGNEDVYDLTVPSTHSMIINGIVSHQCGEQPLGAFSVCNLGAIHLGKFYNAETRDVAWDDLRDAVRYAVRFLDNVIDSTPYFFEENARIQGMERRVGLGTMGIAELMVKLGVRYGSEESLKLIDDVYKLIAVEAYSMSAQIAAEKGAFPAFDAEKFLQSGYMQGMPEDVRALIQQNGIRNVTLLTQAPTGCVTPDTLVSTTDGMTPIVQMGDPNGMQWQLMPRDVFTDTGVRKASHFYINGVAPIKRITTERGYSIAATFNHRLRVIDQNGDYVWRRMDEMQVGDRVVLKRGTLVNGQPSALTPVEQGNRAMSELPQTLTLDFAEMLGLYMGDESVALDADTARFFEANGMLKPAGNHGEGAAGAFIPAKVLQSGREAVAAFLRGLFEADGSVHRGTITLVSTSQTLIQQVQTALLGLGIITNIRTMPKQAERYGDRPLFELRTLNRREAQRFVETVGFISQRKRALAAELGAMSDRGDSIAVPALLNEFYAQSAGLPNVVRQRITGLVSNGALTQHFVREMVSEYPQLSDSRLARLVDLDVYVDSIATIEEGVSPTYDISVPDNHTYIANGFVSHNTTGTMANTSTGVEPFFSWVYYRKSRLGLHEEQVPLVKAWREQNPDATELPDYFVTAMELSPDEHVRVQAAFQRWVDSAISKTANVPNHYTVEQVSDLYKYMYELGCKGGTIYRDGSRDEQVLMLKGDERAESEMEKVKARQDKTDTAPDDDDTDAPASPHRVFPRPVKLTGVTANCPTPFGTAYVTMNVDEHGYPFEVFITAPGKAGSDLQADAEGLGRMISLSLRTTEPHNRREMLKLIIEQLRDIGGSRAVGFGPNRVISLPDSVARALEDHFFTIDQPQQLSLPMGNGNGQHTPHEMPSVSQALNGTAHDSHEASGMMSGADLCPSCGTISLIRAEGCRKCLTCGYSEC